MNRRALLSLGLLGLPVLASGCGFRPLYLPASQGGALPAEELAAIYVPVMAERSGQLLRQALQRRFEGSGLGIAKKYELVVVFGLSTEGVAIQRDNSTTRIRLVGTGTYVLRRLDLAHTVMTTGSARVLDGYNILNQQYFAADLDTDAALRRVSETVADQVTQQLAAWFKTQPGNAAPGTVPRPAGPALAPLPQTSIPPDAISPITTPTGANGLSPGFLPGPL